MALDWSKNGGILAFSLSDSSLFTALANDYSYEDAFVEFMKINSINSNDLVITTSSSGNSKNIVNALNFCLKNKIKTLGLSGLNLENATEKLFRFLYICSIKNIWNGRMYPSSFSSLDLR